MGPQGHPAQQTCLYRDQVVVVAQQQQPLTLALVALAENTVLVGQAAERLATALTLALAEMAQTVSA